MRLNHNLGIVVFGLIEVCIGLVTLAAVITSLVIGKSAKPPEVIIFVLATATISLGLGIGILRLNRAAYHMLLFFAAVIILSKILIFARIISLSGALETSISPAAKNLISIIYHGLLILYFSSPSIRKQFGGKKCLICLQNPHGK